MLAEDPSSILGGSKGTWENPGQQFFWFFTFRAFEFRRRRRRPTRRRARSFALKFEVRWSVRSALAPRRWQGRKRTVTVAILDA